MLKIAKQKLRKEAKILNASFSVQRKLELSALMQQKLLESELWRKAKVVALFMPLPDEPQTALLFKAALEAGKLVLFPRCIVGCVVDSALNTQVAISDIKLQNNLEVAQNLEFKKPQMEFVPCQSLEDFSPQAYGILEPKSQLNALVPGIEPFFSEQALILVPGLAFDKQGTRLGRGAGYYDNYLAQPALKNALFLAYSFSFAVFESLTKEAHDISMHALCTDKELLCFQN